MREVDPDNRRCVLITLTDVGWTVIEDVLAHHLSHEEHALKSLSSPQRKQLAALRRTLLLGLGDEPAPPTRPTADASNHDEPAPG